VKLFSCMVGEVDLLTRSICYVILLAFAGGDDWWMCALNFKSGAKVNKLFKYFLGKTSWLQHCEGARSLVVLHLSSIRWICLLFIYYLHISENRHEFWWFGHSYSHTQAHKLVNFTSIEDDMLLNQAFAKVRWMAVCSWSLFWLSA